MRVGIIGAGPAGMTAAYVLSRAGAAVEVFEASDGIGGLSRTIELWGQKVDLGPHRFFTKDRRVYELWMRPLRDDYRLVDRLTRIYYRQRFFHYPLRPAEALWKLGPWEAARCLASYCKEQLRPSSLSGSEETFQSWVQSRFGGRLFEIFFKTYTEKLWGIPCAQLDADFAAQRIKRFTLGEAIRAALGAARQQHNTLIDRFAYPTGGAGMVYERMARAVRRRGGRIHLNCPVLRVLHDQRRVYGVELAGGGRRHFDYVISTMPLTLLVEGLGDLPAAVTAALGQLGYRNTILVYLHVGGGSLFADQWLYVHSPDLLAGRITNFRNWVPELYGSAQSSIIAMEYWCYDHDPIWHEPDELLVERAVREIRSIRLIPYAPLLGGKVVRLHRSYPVYSKGYKEHLAQVIDFLQTFRGLTVIGRYGSFKYNNQDHSILMGLLAAENILYDRNHDLWAVNTDYDSYQEGDGFQQSPQTEHSLTRKKPATAEKYKRRRRPAARRRRFDRTRSAAG